MSSFFNIYNVIKGKKYEGFFSTMVNIQGEQEDSPVCVRTRTGKGEKERFLMKRRRKEVDFRSHDK